MTSNPPPEGLEAGGRAMWEGIRADYPDLDHGQLAMLEAACRQRDRGDQLAAAAVAGDAGALRHEREASLAMARLVAALRLPDPTTGKRPQSRTFRGVHRPPGPPDDPSVKKRLRLSSLDRARMRAEGDGRWTAADFHKGTST